VLHVTGKLRTLQREGWAFGEAPTGFEPVYDGFANRCLTTWLRRRNAPPV
jgi:hypothetical protein